jgi:hypothetical protein
VAKHHCRSHAPQQEAAMILEAVDKVYGVSQMVGKVFGFINAQDATIHDRVHEGRHIGHFTSPDPGWSELAIELPPDAEFRSAISGPLTRSGSWISSKSRSEVRAYLEPRLADFNGVWKPWQHGDWFEARSTTGYALSMRIARHRDGTMIVVIQTRGRDQLKASMLERLRAQRASRSAQ